MGTAQGQGQRRLARWRSALGQPRRRVNRAALARLLCAALAALAAIPVAAQPGYEPLCGTEGVWLQVLGSGDGTLNGRGSASYLVWLDDKARLLVDPGPGSSVRFGEAKADFNDLDAIVFSNAGTARTADLPAFIMGSEGRTRRLPVLGPAGGDNHPATSELIRRLLGPEGAYGEFAGHLVPRQAAYRIDVEDVPAVGSRRWTGFGSPRMSLSAIPVHHSGAPSLAWRVRIGGKTVVFTGNFSNRNDAVWRFARQADALVIHHAIPEGARGAVRERHVTPAQIGRIAQRADARTVLLGHRAPRTLGLESMSRAALEAHYTGPLLFANELECWGL